jgi:hypothetical protein
MFSLRTNGFDDVASVLVASNSVWVPVVALGGVEVTGEVVWMAMSVVVHNIDAGGLVWVPEVVVVVERSIWVLESSPGLGC